MRFLRRRIHSASGLFSASHTDRPVSPSDDVDALSLAEVITHLERIAPPELALEWDSVGLICGDPQAPVRRVLFAVDPVACIVDEACEIGADLIVTHHPLYLRGTHHVVTTDPKGRLVHRLISNGIALYNAHTNLDAVSGGVADCLADLIHLADRVALEPVRALTHASGDDGGASAMPVCEGIGRIGNLPAPMTLRALASHLARALPDSTPGLLISGDLDSLVSRVAVSGGAGDSLMGTARAAGAEVFITADLRHHPASEHSEGGMPHLLCATHWASEWVGLPPFAARLESAAAGAGHLLETHVSERVTDPWTARMATGPLSGVLVEEAAEG